VRDKRDEPRSYGEYDIESVLGKGSIGQVFLARHRRIGRKVALKTVRPEQRFDDESDRAEFYKRLQREAELCAALQHPNVVTLYEVGYEDDVVSYLATEYVAGESLLARLRRTRPLPLNEALSIGADVLRALAYAHGKGVIHRDVKPANILITPEGQAKIADFGIARPLQSSLTGTNSLLGTPNYMSPEQVKSAPVTTRADLFCAGIVMYEMLTGVKPFSAPDLSAILYNVVNLDPPLANTVNPAVPEPIAHAVARLLAKSPLERYANASEALRDIEQGRTSVPSPAPETQTMITAPLGGEGATEDEPESLSLSFEITQPWFRREIPAQLFWGLTAALLIALAVPWTILQKAAEAEQPSAVVTHEQLVEQGTKRHALAEARAYVAAGKYDEAVKRYDAYLAKYPASVTARTERDEAQRMFENRAAKSTMTVTKSKGRRAPEEPKPTKWDRVKRWLRGK
jgi:serine/threonine protein kinase